jgi:hypothetical protein
VARPWGQAAQEDHQCAQGESAGALRQCALLLFLPVQACGNVSNPYKHAAQVNKGVAVNMGGVGCALLCTTSAAVRVMYICLCVSSHLHLLLLPAFLSAAAGGHCDE